MKLGLQPQQEGEKTMNDEERALDLQLGDALAEIESLKAENRNLACDIVEIATLRDKLLTEQGVVLRELTEAMLVVTAERDALKAGLAQPSATDAELSRKHTFVRKTLAHHGIGDVPTALVADLIHGLAAQPEKVKPWVGLTDGENHIAEVLNKTLGLQYVADKLREKNT